MNGRNVVNSEDQISQPSHFAQRGCRLTTAERCMCGMAGGILAVLIFTAAWLRPDPSGLGTHQQLGLPGCTVYTWFGIRCPGCGMTTSWAHTMDGDLANGLKANVGGVLLLIMALLSAPCLVLFAVTGVAYHLNAVSKIAIFALCVVAAVSILQWMIRLASA